MKKSSKIFIVFIIVEAVLTAYFFYIQPQCEPCLPKATCPPCISDTQIKTFWAGIFIAVLTISYLLFNKFSKSKYGR